jgi:hypothetical protein
MNFRGLDECGVRVAGHVCRFLHVPFCWPQIARTVRSPFLPASRFDSLENLSTQVCGVILTTATMSSPARPCRPHSHVRPRPSVWVNNNGILSFQEAVPTYSKSCRETLSGVLCCPLSPFLFLFLAQFRKLFRSRDLTSCLHCERHADLRRFRSTLRYAPPS